jgi:hypothetical protein
MCEIDVRGRRPAAPRAGRLIGAVRGAAEIAVGGRLFGRFNRGGGAK